MRQVSTVAALLAFCATLQASAAPPPRLLQDPSLSATRIAFAFAGEIWTVPREGGEASRLVSGQLRNRRPVFSPDGATIAFTGIYDENADVYVVASGGGEPRRLTHHPGPDIALGFTPDGKKVIFASMRRTVRDLPKLFTVPVAGGPPEELPLPSGADASFSPDGKRLAYVPFAQWQPAWKKYRGGQTTPVWIADLADSRVVKLPRENSNDRRPIWVGDTVYFLSDRNGPVTLFAFDLKTGGVREVVKNADGFDVQSASAGPGAIVFDQFGELKLLDLASGTTRTVPVTISADLPQVRSGFRKVEPEQVLHAALSPAGKRVLFEARGEILSVPAEKGDARNLTRSPGVADRDPSFSPDGKWVAWLSDESGEYALHLRAPDGMGPVRKVGLGLPPSFFYAPRFSPDSKKIALTDKRMNLWVVEVEKGAKVKVDSDLFDTPLSNLDPAWSADSRWIAYVKQLPNHLRAVFVHSLEEKKSRQVTDGRSDAVSPRFDRNGKYLYFLASTDAGLAQGWLDMTSMSRPVTSSLYAAVLRKDIPSPVAPESDEEGGADGKDGKGSEAAKPGSTGEAGKGESKKSEASKDAAGKGAAVKDAKKPPEPVKIDFDGLDQRIVALPVERANWVALETGAEGIVFLLQAPTALAAEDYLEFDDDNPPPVDVHRFDLKARKAEKFVEKIDGGSGVYGGQLPFLVSSDGAKALYRQKNAWFLVPSEKAPKAGDGALKVEGLEVWVDPRAEWRQMYREAWRIQRDFLYDPGAHGLDLVAAEKLYEPFVDGIAGREDLNRLFVEMLGHLVLGHVYVRGGAIPNQEKVSVGLLGADYTVAEGRYRIARILPGENWNPKLKAPLTQPGVDVKEGDFLLAVNGQELKGDDDIHRLFLGTAGKQTVLTVGPKADGTGSRQVTVVPAGSEGGLRLRTWMEENRKKVDALSGGKVGYVFIPDTFAEGFTNFNRYYFSEIGKEALVVDERFNHGGSIADYIVDLLARKPTMANASREGEDVVSPAQAVFGPKVMLINQMSGSGGDALPWLFRKAKLGPIVGKRTWGGLVGIGGYPALIDGGSVTAPRWGLYGTEGEWEVENAGIAPDVEVEEDPALIRQGKDPQLERAVQLALEALSKNPPVRLKRPKYPDYGPRLPKRVP
ncbi:MAG: PDZ domain-containing protein [Thermoanaerobaculia bacterium]|nr:PDZ domain-containing protein [Thermoanaerobaculia bacterium]